MFWNGRHTCSFIRNPRKPPNPSTGREKKLTWLFSLGLWIPALWLARAETHGGTSSAIPVPWDSFSSSLLCCNLWWMETCLQIFKRRIWILYRIHFPLHPTLLQKASSFMTMYRLDRAVIDPLFRYLYGIRLWHCNPRNRRVAIGCEV